MYICKCGKQFEKRYSYIGHSSTCGKEKKKCEKCGKFFTRLGKHDCEKIKIRVKKIKPDSKEKNIKCTICGNLFNSLGIGSHIWRMHGNGQNFDPNIGFKNERQIWNKGLTKEADIRVKKCGDTLSRHIKDGVLKIKRKKKFYSDKQKYKACASFRFSLNSYSSEFEFELIEKYGWYKAVNNGNNLKGVSRDHIFSVKEGMKQNINPFLLSHPVNCQLMVHTKNMSKGKKCGITVDELIVKIKEWNEKYGEYFKFDINEEWERVKSISLSTK